jgi:hypothetical protein
MRWRLQMHLGGLGLPGAAGALVLLAGAWIWLVDVPRANEELARIEREVARAASVRPRTNSDEPDPTAVSAADPLPEAAAAGQVPIDILLALRAAGLDVGEVSVRDAERIGESTRAIDLTVSASGSYRDIKRGLDDLLQRHASLALMHLSLAGADAPVARERALEARMRLRYYHQAPR